MGWSGGAMVLGEPPEPRRPTLAEGAGGGVWPFFLFRLSFLVSLFLSLGDGQI